MIEKFEPKEIFLTENAISKILSLREEESNKSLMLRVFVTGGGCSGFQYGFKFDDQKDDEDTLVDFDGADVVVDPLSMQYVFGSTIDYVQNLEGAKFVVDNPNVKKEILNNKEMIDQEKIDLVARMGGDWYCRTDKNSMFEIKKPITTCGIGWDNIPKEILSSTILSGNDLGKLGGIEQLPDETEVNEFKLMELSDLFIAYEDDAKKLETLLHEKSKEYLKKDELENTWKTLLSFNN